MTLLPLLAGLALAQPPPPPPPVFAKFPPRGEEGITLEGILLLPGTEGDEPAPALVMCHPDPRMGGAMTDFVVMGVCDEVLRQGIAVMRFNFRGVGGSGGQTAGGEREVDDVLAAHSWLQLKTGHEPHLVGYSFGGVMALAALAQGGTVRSLCCVGFPAALSALSEERLAAARRVTAGPTPVLFIAGDQDRLHDLGWMTRNLAGPSATFDTMPGEDHYFTDSADRLAQRVAVFIGGVDQARP